MLHNFIKVFFIIVCQLTVYFSSAQNECGSASLDTAEDRYAIGNLTACISGLQYCLQHKGFHTDEQVHAYKLIAMSYLAIDLRNSADSAIQNIFFLQPDFNADVNDPERFKNELTFLRANQSENIISSVSKRPEDIRLAPATTTIITQEEILQRGYTDLIDILKDIPGFDISVYYGQLYANVYQRGLRTNNTDKTLLLFDGIEDNDLWSNFADVSQQYPVTNIKQVEVIYGPASTMYGPNAFSGVINVITKDAKDYLHNNRSFGLQLNAGAGTYNTKYFDLSTAYKKGIVSFTATGRLYYSDRPDLSSQTLFDYDSSYFSSLIPNVDTTYKRLFHKQNGAAYLDANKIPYPKNLPGGGKYTDSTNGLFTVNYKPNGKPTTFDLTDLGVHAARELDQLAYISPAYAAFHNPAKSFYINTKVTIGNLSAGFVSWNKNEGAGTTYTDRFSSVNGTRWKPEHFYLFSNYTQQLSNKLNISITTNYRVHRIANGSKITKLKSYLNGNFDIADLENNMPASLLTTYYFEQSQQFRSEAKIAYTQSKNFNMVSGIEVRNGLFQKFYLEDTLSNPEKSGRSRDSTGNNFYHVKDIGAYAQATLRTNTGLGLTLGARIDNNVIDETKGLGTTISPRIAADYSFRKLTCKAVYSSGIQNVSNFTRFEDVVLIPDDSSENLKPEKISNYEVSVSANLSKHLTADIDGFYSLVKNVVSTIVLGNIKQNENIGEFRIWGLQANVTYKAKNIQVLLNYTFTDPKQISGVSSRPVIKIDTAKQDTSYVNTSYIVDTSKRVADIASSKINVIINYSFLKHFNLNLRANYVSSKKTGPETTAPNNLLPAFPGYFLSNASFTISDPFNIKGVLLQLNCNNIFNKTYYSPGIRGAGGLNYPNQILQMGRNFSIKLNYEL